MAFWGKEIGYFEGGGQVQIVFFFGPNGLFLGLKTVLGSNHVVEQLSFPMIP